VKYSCHYNEVLKTCKITLLNNSEFHNLKGLWKGKQEDYEVSFWYPFGERIEVDYFA
jgi:hypothetical protein